MRAFRWMLALAGFVTALSGIVGAQEACLTRTVRVTVIDRKTARPVEGLTAADFRAKSGRTEMKVRSVRNAPGQRRFLILLDTSGSMRSFVPMHTTTQGKVHTGSKWLVGNAALAALVADLPKDASLGLLEFGGTGTMRIPFTTDRAVLSHVAELPASLSYPPPSQRGAPRCGTTWTPRLQSLPRRASAMPSSCSPMVGITRVRPVGASSGESFCNPALLCTWCCLPTLSRRPLKKISHEKTWRN